MLEIPRRTLADLPPPSTDIFTLRHPWCPILARVLVEALNVDHGLLGVWRMRGVGPKALPAEWTKGRGNAYLITDALAWLAARRGETFSSVEVWRQSLRDDLGTETHTEAETRRWVRIYAEAAGPRLPGGVEFTRQGFAAYLDALMAG